MIPTHTPNRRPRETYTVGTSVVSSRCRHLGETVPLSDTHSLEARAEVGLLTHNVVFRGSDDPVWHDKIEACPEGFDTGQIRLPAG